MEAPVSAEHVEAAKEYLRGSGVFNRDHSKAARLAQADRLAAFLAARDAERDARWEALKVATTRLVGACQTNKHMRDEYLAEQVWSAGMALANLGAEEKR